MNQSINRAILGGHQHHDRLPVHGADALRQYYDRLLDSLDRSISVNNLERLVALLTLTMPRAGARELNGAGRTTVRTCDERFFNGHRVPQGIRCGVSLPSGEKL